MAHIMRNNIGFPNKNSNMGGVDTSFNTWDLAITPANNDAHSKSQEMCVRTVCPHGLRPHVRKFMSVLQRASAPRFRLG